MESVLVELGFVLVNVIARYTVWLPRKYKKVKKKTEKIKIKICLVTIKKIKINIRKKKNGKHKRKGKIGNIYKMFT